MTATKWRSFFISEFYERIFYLCKVFTLDDVEFKGMQRAGLRRR